ncbi:MAG TPA: SBBP repeat-containing protein [Chloroflexia bacterium]|nr:SBBP repeat-containing protein [Chloroflexia bacterium]
MMPSKVARFTTKARLLPAIVALRKGRLPGMPTLLTPMHPRRIPARHFLILAVVLQAILIVSMSPVWLPTRQGAAISPEHATLGKAPLYFEPAAGHITSSSNYVARNATGTLLFTPSEVVLSLRSAEIDVVRLQFVGAAPTARIDGGEMLPGKVNYMVGSDPGQWRTGLPTYNHITYKDLYPGVDLLYEGSNSELKGTYTLAPNADPSSIRWRYNGAQSVTIDQTGNLQITVQGSEARDQGPGLEDKNSALSTQHSALVERAPAAWQERDGRRMPVSASYVLFEDGSVGFRLGAYDRALPLTIDPEITLETYFGGSNNDFGEAIARDASGNIYIAGWTTSPDFPVVNAFQSKQQSLNDAIITKLSPDGSTMIYSTYLGGQFHDRALGIAVDGAGSAYVTGLADSPNFPTTPGSFQPNEAGGGDAFITKLSPTGSSLAYSTYLGGPLVNKRGEDVANAIVVVDGNAYVAGWTSSAQFPVLNAAQPTYGGGGSDAFLAKLNSQGSALIYSTYIGGTGTTLNNDQASSLALDGAGNAYITGFTTGDFPTVNAFQPEYGGGEGDAFVTKVSPSGSAFLYSTYLGGDDNFGDGAADIAVDGAGNAYITGLASSDDFPTLNAFQSSLNGDMDAFVTKFSSTGSLAYSTFLGGGGTSEIFEGGSSIAVDSAGSAYVTGITGLTAGFPTVNPMPPGPGGYRGLFITKMAPTGSALLFSTLLPGNPNLGQYTGRQILLDGAGGIYLGGNASPAFEGDRGEEVFVIKIAEQATGTQTPTAISTAASTSTGTPAQPSPTRTATPTADATHTTTAATSTPTITVVAPSSTPTACPIQFTDVPQGSTFYANIRCLACRGILGGYSDGTFRPNNDITRGQLSKIVANSAGFNEPVTGRLFEDIPATHAFYTWIQRLASRGHIGGYPCGGAGEPCGVGNLPYFRPNANATRGQITKIVSNAAGFSEPPGGQLFDDVAPGDTFYEWVQRLASRGIMGGYPCGGAGEPCGAGYRPYFRPNNAATRGQVSKIVANTFFSGCEMSVRR